MIWSDEEEKGVEAEGVELDSEGVAWAEFDSSHRPFLQQGDSRKSNRQEETLSTTTTARGLKTHASCSDRRRKKGHAKTAHRAETPLSGVTLNHTDHKSYPNKNKAWRGDFNQLVAVLKTLVQSKISRIPLARLPSNLVWIFMVPRR